MAKKGVLNSQLKQYTEILHARAVKFEKFFTVSWVGFGEREGVTMLLDRSWIKESSLVARLRINKNTRKFVDLLHELLMRLVDGGCEIVHVAFQSYNAVEQIVSEDFEVGLEIIARRSNDRMLWLIIRYIYSSQSRRLMMPAGKPAG